MPHEGVEKLFDGLFGCVLHDKDKPRSAVVIRPFIKPLNGMKDMLDTMNNSRLVVAVDIDDAFDAQHILAHLRGQDFKEKLEIHAIHRRIADQREGLDIASMPVDVMCVVVMMMAFIPYRTGCCFFRARQALS